MGVRRLTGRVHTIVIPTRVSKAMENPVISKTNRRKCRSTEGANLTLPNPIGTVPASMGRRCCMGFGRTTCLTAATNGSSPMRWGCGVVVVVVVSVWSQSASATWCWRGVLESSGQVRVCVCVCVLQNVVFIYFFGFFFSFFLVLLFLVYFLLFCIFIVFVCLYWVEFFSVFLFTPFFLIFSHFLLFIYLFILTLT